MSRRFTAHLFVRPTDAGGQFADRGSSYRAAIFYHNDKQKELAEASKQRLAESGIFKDPIVTDILKAEPFYASYCMRFNDFIFSSLLYAIYLAPQCSLINPARPEPVR